MNVEKFLTIEKFCWRYDLKTGGQITGYLDLILSLIGIVANHANFPSLHWIVDGVCF